MKIHAWLIALLDTMVLLGQRIVKYVFSALSYALGVHQKQSANNAKTNIIISIIFVI